MGRQRIGAIRVSAGTAQGAGPLNLIPLLTLLHFGMFDAAVGVKSQSLAEFSLPRTGSAVINRRRRWSHVSRRLR